PHPYPQLTPDAAAASPSAPRLRARPSERRRLHPASRTLAALPSILCCSCRLPILNAMRATGSRRRHCNEPSHGPSPALIALLAQAAIGAVAGSCWIRLFLGRIREGRSHDGGRDGGGICRAATARAEG
ncbi:unnamed protein product, partial [Urochloa humidicola]